MTTLAGMSGIDQPDPPATPQAVQLEGEMDSKLAQLRQETSGPVTSRLNPVFQHEQRAGTAADEADATETAARVSGEMAAEADQERVTIEGLVKRVTQAAPGSDKTRDAQAAAAQAEHDADEAVAASLDSDAAAEEADRAEGAGLFHRGADPAPGGIDMVRALQDESVVGKDLRDLDALGKRVSGDKA